jgi:putative tryptophan/tyrosine transport system substrate-binding protein
MRLIGLAVVLAVSLTLGSFAAEAQQTGKVNRMGYLGNFPPSPATFTALREGLGEYGYVEGRNLIIESRFAQGREERYPELVRELVEANVELVMTAQTPAAFALKNGTAALPIVLLSVSHPVETGLVQSLARPGGNVTGLSNQAVDLDAKVVQLTRELIVRKLSRLAFLWSPTNKAATLSLKTMQAVAAKEGFSLMPVAAPSQTPEELERVITAVARERPDALYMHGTYASKASTIGALAIRHRLPTIGVISPMTRDGLLMS